MNNSNNILNSLEGIKKASPKPFLTTRVMAALSKQPSFWDKTLAFILKPAIAIVSIVLIMALNIFVFFGKTNKDSTDTQIINEDDYVIQNYDLGTVISYEKNIDNEK